MPKLHHKNKSISSVKARAKIKQGVISARKFWRLSPIQKIIEIMLNSDGKSDNPLNQALLR
jgi:hypothetical protein